MKTVFPQLLPTRTQVHFLGRLALWFVKAATYSRACGFGRRGRQWSTATFSSVARQYEMTASIYD